MQSISSEELDRRINTFLNRKHQEYPELKLRTEAPKQKKEHSVTEVFADLVAGFKWEFGR